MSPEQVIEAALSSSSAGDDRHARDLLLPLAEAGHVQAQSHLGVICQLLNDLPGALRWLRIAAEAGDGAAAHNLGVAYLTGESPDFQQAQHWLHVSYACGFESTISSDPLWFTRPST